RGRHLLGAALRELPRAGHACSHQEMRRLVLAVRAGLAVVRRAEVVADLVRRDERARELAERRLRERDAEASRADHADVRDAGELSGRAFVLVEIPAGEKMSETAGPERRIRE